jgi:hypothetical protein
MSIRHIPLIMVIVIVVSSCINPFAPRVDESNLFDELLGNPKTIDGFYIRFQNAYQFRDTTLYGPLIDPDFSFIFRDYDRNLDVTWSRAEDLNSTYNLFVQSQDIQLSWNNIVLQSVNPEMTRAQIVRRFNLLVVINSNDIIRTDGSANFVLARADSTLPWKLLQWRDESEL